MPIFFKEKFQIFTGLYRLLNIFSLVSVTTEMTID